MTKTAEVEQYEVGVFGYEDEDDVTLSQRVIIHANEISDLTDDQIAEVLAERAFAAGVFSIPTVIENGISRILLWETDKDGTLTDLAAYALISTDEEKRLFTSFSAYAKAYIDQIKRSASSTVQD